MRLLIHSVNYGELTGPGKYATELCEWLAARGHEVTVVAPPPYFPQWRVDPVYSSAKYSTSIENGVKVRRVPTWIPHAPTGLRRVLYTLTFAVASLPILLQESTRRPETVFTVEPSIVSVMCAWIAARFAGARAWLHVQDFEIDLAFDLGQLRHGRSLASALERWLMRRFDMVSSISHSMMNRLRRKGVPSNRTFLLPNWFATDKIVPSPVSALRGTLAIPAGTLVGLYSGSLGVKQGVEMILGAARSLRDLPVLLIICGEGVGESALRSAAASAENVRVLKLQPAEGLNDLLNLADFHLLPQRRGTAGSLFPSKLIGMLASGRPVIAMAETRSEIADCLQDCGICVGHGDIQAFAAAIRHLATDAEERAALGRKARECALRRFRQDTVLEQFETALARLVRRQPAPDLVDSTEQQG